MTPKQRAKIYRKAAFLILENPEKYILFSIKYFGNDFTEANLFKIPKHKAGERWLDIDRCTALLLCEQMALDNK